MGIILCIVYIAIACLGLFRLKWFQEIGLSTKVLLVLFFIKIIGGFVNHYVMMTRFYGGDSHGYYLEVHEYFASHTPAEILKYFILGFNPFHWNETIFSPHNAIAWSDLGAQLNIRLAMICEFLGGGSEYVYVVIYNILFFIGQLALLKGFTQLFPNQKFGFILAIFLIPSVWFWCSGVHKDGFQLATLGFIFYYLVQLYQAFEAKYLVKLFVFLILTFLIRYHIIIALGPALVILWICIKYKKGLKTAGIIILGYAFCLANIGKVFTSVDPLKMICYKQSQFEGLRGGSLIEVPNLEPTAISFLKNIPVAYNHVLMRPYIWEAKDIMYLFAAIETILILLLIGLGIYKSDRQKWEHPFILYSICLVLVMYLIIGYIVPFSGAFVRYRATLLPFLMCSLIAIQPKSVFEKWANFIYNKF